MSGSTTKVMLKGYQARRRPTMFLTGMFQAPLENFHNSEEVEIDIMRSEEDISIAITDLATGARLNSDNGYTNKSFKPPIHKEASAISAHKLIQREFGQNPFQNPDFQVNAVARGLREVTRISDKISRAIEYQASQVLQTGTVTLIDEAGNSVYTIDYKPKPTHFPTSSVAWDNASSTKLKDIEDLANTIRADGLEDPDMLVMGERAYELFMADEDVKSKLDLRRADTGRIVPMQMMGNGGIYRGTVEIGNYKYDIYTYAGRYKHPQTGASTKYLADDKVIVRSSQGRLDATFGGIPTIDRDSRVPSELFTRLRDSEGVMDLQTKGWVTQDGETMWVQAGTRPLLIPTAIDTFGCLDINI
ncbi:major capsid protein [Francisella philomiragia]|uniref:major capsid protein n=1 Tax=Francisella philomiragia TaxID=28110 RepID=UPI002242FFE7|nr:major capsid protein [Francisella philomiragia]